MNFFQHQDQARRQTRWLVILFFLAVIALIAITTLFVIAFFAYLDLQSGSPSHLVQQAGESGFELNGFFIPGDLLINSSLIVIAIVFLGSFYKLRQLKAGGVAVATRLGGRLVQPNSTESQERQLLNVVEEMAIAAGVPVPPVFLLDEGGINAFAAGFQPKDAVIGITRGALQQLNRDQLQGVMAHEFSHILNGDMRMNMRLTGTLNGILVIGLLGSGLLRSSAGHRYGSRNNKNAGGLIILGFGLTVIGYVGTFFGQLIKAAVSRQREFLADASAVQFTRNPSGISEALQIIGGSVLGSRLNHPNTEQFSHMYFSNSLESVFFQLFATHPPLAQRIRRITPRWNGKFIDHRSGTTVTNPVSSVSAPVSAIASEGMTATPHETAPLPDEVLRHVIQPSFENLDLAQQYLAALPEQLRQAAHEPYAARAIIYNLLIQEEYSKQQWHKLKQHAHPEVFRLTQQLYPEVAQLPAELKLPLVEIAIPALKTLSQPQYQRFKYNLVTLIKADKKTDIFEWALYRLINNHLTPEGANPPRQSYNLSDLVDPISDLVSIISWAGHPGAPHQAFAAFNAAIQELQLNHCKMLSQKEISLSRLNGAIDKLTQLKILQKPLLLRALVQGVKFDGEITAAEYQLFSVIALCLDCPAPPLMPIHKPDAASKNLAASV